MDVKTIALRIYSYSLFGNKPAIVIKYEVVFPYALRVGLYPPS